MMLKDNIDLSAVRQRIAGFVNGHNNDVTKIFENHAVLSVMAHCKRNDTFSTGQQLGRSTNNNGNITCLT